MIKTLAKRSPFLILKLSLLESLFLEFHLSVALHLFQIHPIESRSVVGMECVFEFARLVLLQSC